MRSLLYSTLFLMLLLGCAGGAHAEVVFNSAASLSYPVAQLGNCSSQSDCKAYCDESSHVHACLAFAQSHHLMAPSDIQKALLLLSLTGPGGCKGQECVAYCDSRAHVNECIAFAQRIVALTEAIRSANGTTSPAQASFKSGPGGCMSLSQCAAYCLNHPDICKSATKTPAHDAAPESTQFLPIRLMSPQREPSSYAPVYIAASVFSAFLLFLHL